MMTNKEKYKKAFSAVKPSGEIHLEVEKMSEKHYRSLRTVIASAVCCCLLAGTAVTAYANNVWGIQRMIQVWIHGDLTDAVFEFNQNEGTYSLDYTDENGEKKHESGGGGLLMTMVHKELLPKKKYGMNSMHREYSTRMMGRYGCIIVIRKLILRICSRMMYVTSV